MGGVLRQSIGFLLIPLYTRVLEPDEYGLLALLAVVATLAGLLPQATFGPALFRSYFDYEDEENRAVVVSTALYLIVVFSGLLSVVGWVFAAPLSAAVLHTPAHVDLLRIVFLTSLLGSVEVVTFAVFRARLWSVRFTAISLAAFGVQMAATIYLVAALRLGVLGVLAGNLLGAAAAVALQLPLIWRQLRPALSLGEFRKMLRYGLPFVPEGVFAFVIASADRLALESLTSLAVVGVYALGFRLAQVVRVLLYAPFNIVEPVAIFSVEKRADAKHFYARLLTYACLAGLWLSLGVSLAAREAVRLLANPAYRSAYQVVPLLCLFVVFQGVRGLGSVGLNLQRRTEFVPLAEAAGMVVTVALLLLLIPRFGMLGAGAAMSVSYLTVFGVRTVAGQRIYRVEFEWARLGKLFFVAAGLYFAGRLASPANVWLALALQAVVALSYPFVLYIAGFFATDEKQALRRWLATSPLRRLALAPPDA